MAKNLVLVAALTLVGLLLAPSANAQPSCGAGTYYDPATNSCVATQQYQAPYDPGYYGGGGYVQFCFNGWLFSFCTGR